MNEDDVYEDQRVLVEKMLTTLIDKGYSQEICEAFPPSMGILLLKKLAFLLLIFSIVFYFLTYRLLLSFLILASGIISYWLCGVLRGIQLKRDVLSTEDKSRMFLSMFKSGYRQ